ncbi:hypothetical protein [Lactococcus lactis]|uniref:hypothetical protein n=1 Tax=Lactococcus lactis TaxID=1358 RepID=UPI0024A9975D|nr:hypothetical protein [Lactococcus lactis]
MKTSSKLHIIDKSKNMYKEFKNQLLVFIPIIIEVGIFFAYIVSLHFFQILIYWKLITILFFVILCVIAKKLNKTSLRFKVHIFLNLIFLASFFISMQFFPNDKQTLIYDIGLLLNFFFQFECIIYIVLESSISKLETAQIRLSQKQASIISSITSILLFGIALLITGIKKDNWIIVGLFAAFMNHIFNEKGLLSLKYKSNSEIDEAIEKYGLKKFFWIVKSIGLAFILSWGVSLFSFKNLNQMLVIVVGMYLCLGVIVLICVTFTIFLNDIKSEKLPKRKYRKRRKKKR